MPWGGFEQDFGSILLLKYRIIIIVWCFFLSQLQQHSALLSFTPRTLHHFMFRWTQEHGGGGDDWCCGLFFIWKCTGYENVKEAQVQAVQKERDMTGHWHYVCVCCLWKLSFFCSRALFILFPDNDNDVCSSQSVAWLCSLTWFRTTQVFTANQTLMCTRGKQNSFAEWNASSVLQINVHFLPFWLPFYLQCVELDSIKLVITDVLVFGSIVAFFGFWSTPSVSHNLTTPVSSAEQLDLEKPLKTAMLLSMGGVGCVVLNQWHSSFHQNTHNMASVLDSRFLKE